MSQRLKVELNEGIKEQESRNKKLWNFVRGDISALLLRGQFEGMIEVTHSARNTFLIERRLTEEGYTIGPDLAFADGLELDLHDPAFSSLLLAILMRLQQTYKEAFNVACDSYSVVDAATKRLQNTLQITTSRPWLSSFIDYPCPGRKPQANKPLTSVEVRRNMIHKKRAEGSVSLSTWLTESVKKELDQFCQNQGVTIEEALNKLIPIGINTTCSVLKNFAPALK